MALIRQYEAGLGHSSPVLVALLVMLYVGWRVYRRTRWSIGRQRLQRRRMVYRIAVFSAMGLFMAGFALPHFELALSLGAGFVLGVLVALVGLNLTRFERTDDGHFYTPNTFIGVTLCVLLMVRLGYRMFRIYSVSQTAGPQLRVGYSGLTLFLFGLLASYYVAYYLGVFIRCRQLQPVAVGSTRQP